MSRGLKIVLTSVAAGLIVVVVGVGALWYFVLRSDAPPRAALPEREEEPEQEPSEVDGTWTVIPPTDGELVFVGYRVEELFAGETIRNTAVGRTSAVTGTMTIADGQVTDVEIVADLTQLASDQDRRDNYLRDNSLQTNTFPEARFVLTEPIDLDPVPDPGDVISVVATGELTLRDVTRPVAVEIEARWNGEAIDVAGLVPTIVFADYGITTPSVAILTDVGDQGEMELQLVFDRA